MIFKILSIATIGVLLQNFKGYQWMLEKSGFNRKPFNCTMCATFWYSVGPLIYYTNLADGIGAAAIASILAEWIDQQINLMKP